MRLLLLLLLCVGWVLPSTPPTNTCFCVIPEVQEAFDYANAVFLGEVTDIVPPKTTNEKAPASDRFYRIRFKVKRSWKGVRAGETTFEVLAAQGLGCLSYPAVKKGELHLIYADRSQQRGLSAISGCGRSTAVRFKFRSELVNPEAIDPFQEMKQLDVIANGLLPNNANRPAGRGLKFD